MTPEEHLAHAEQLVDEATGMDIDQQLGVHLELAKIHVSIAQAAAAVGVTGNLARFIDLAEADQASHRAALRAAAGEGPS